MKRKIVPTEQWCNDCQQMVDVVHSKVYDCADADGNRGRWFDVYQCNRCEGEDLDENIEQEG